MTCDYCLFLSKFTFLFGLQTLVLSLYIFLVSTPLHLLKVILNFYLPIFFAVLKFYLNSLSNRNYQCI